MKEVKAICWTNDDGNLMVTVTENNYASNVSPCLVLIPDNGENVEKIFKDMCDVCTLEGIRSGKQRVLKDGHYILKENDDDCWHDNPCFGLIYIPNEYKDAPPYGSTIEWMDAEEKVSIGKFYTFWEKESDYSDYIWAAILPNDTPLRYVKKVNYIDFCRCKQWRMLKEEK